MNRWSQEGSGQTVLRSCNLVSLSGRGLGGCGLNVLEKSKSRVWYLVLFALLEIGTDGIFKDNCVF